MKFEVFAQNPVNINVVFKGRYSDLVLDDNIDVNVKYITPFRIIVETEFVFYYAVDEYNVGWRTIDITYLANKKVQLTLLSQKLRIADEDFRVCKVRGDLHIDTEQGDNDTLNNLAISTFVQTDKNKLAPKINTLTHEWEEVCIMQFTENIGRNADVSPRITQNFFCDGLDYFKNQAPTQVCDIDTMITGSTGVYTYIIQKSSIPNVEEDNWKYVNDMLSEFVGDAELNKIFINARIVKLPRDYLETSTMRFGIVYQYNEDDERIMRFDISQILNFSIQEWEIDNMNEVEGDVLCGLSYWRVGEYIIYPKVDQYRDYSLKMLVIIGVGTVFAVFYTGDYESLMMFPQNMVVTELGYNMTPNTINPSLYYTNKQYQSLVDTRSTMTGISGMLGTLAGILLMPKATAIAKIAMGVAGASSAVTSMINAEAQAERERANRATVKNTNDVQAICNYIGCSPIVCSERYDHNLSPIVVKNILDNYQPHYVVSNFYGFDRYGYGKFSWMEFEKNREVYSNGFILVGVDDLRALLNECNI